MQASTTGSHLAKINTALAVYVALLLLLALALPGEVIGRIFSEEGPFEIGSIVFWLALLPIVFYFRSIWDRRMMLALMAISLIAAMREADFQKKFTSEGFLKINYYLNPNISFEEKILPAIVAAGILLLILFALYRAFQFVMSAKGMASRTLLIEVLAILGISKVFDRMINVLSRDFAYEVDRFWAPIIQALEEGLETIVPILCILAIFLRSKELESSKREEIRHS